MSSSFTNESGAAANNIAAAVLAGQETARPEALHDGERFWALPVANDADLRVLDLDALAADYDDKYGSRPRRKTGTVHVQDADSFVSYIGKHQLTGTEVFADLARQKLVGVINAHEESSADGEEDAGHGDHRVALELIATPEWQVWIANDKKLLNQQAFAEHLEDNAADVIDPDAAVMVEIASSLLATTGVDFKQAVRLDNGQVQMRYEETTTARAGHVGDLDIPQHFTIQVAPFVGSAPVELTARFRYRINGGNLAMSYALLRPEQVAREAFLNHVEQIREAVTVPVFQGRPE